LSIGAQALRAGAHESYRMTKTLALRNALTIPLLLGGVVLWQVGWYVGVALLWTSPTWRRRDKILATVVVPGGVPIGFLIGAFGLPGTPATKVPGLVGVLQVALVVAPMLVAVRLAWVAIAAGFKTRSAATG
jgi:hypothetical protein